MPVVDEAAETKSVAVKGGYNTTSPFIHKFKTERNAYVFDVNTGEIVRVDNVVWRIIEDSYYSKDDVISKHTTELGPDQIARAYDEICTVRNTEGLFLDFRPEISMLHDRSTVRDLINSGREQLILNVTERCNFRCAYCSYTRQDTTWRRHGTQDMSWETARAAIDDFLEHCHVCEVKPKSKPASDSGSSIEIDERIPPAVSFYGGEPLLNFPLIKKCTEYILENTKGQRIGLSIATNGYLLKGEAAKFLATRGFFVRVSMDGPASIHDRNRRTAEGLSTWSTVVQNLKTYLRDYPDNLPAIAVTIPRTANLLEVQRYFAAAKWIPNNVSVAPGIESEPDSGYFDSVNYPKGDPEGTAESVEEYFTRLIDGWGLSKRRDKEFLFQGSLFERMLRNLHRRGRIGPGSEHQHLPERYAAFTTCVAGARRTFVAVNGHYYPCERVPTCENYRIGSVSTGLDVEKIYMLAKYFTECTHAQCKNCWCLPMCQIGCYSAIRERISFTKALKEHHCEEHRRYMQNMLVQYCELLERNPHALDHTSMDYQTQQAREKIKKTEKMRLKAQQVG